MINFPHQAMLEYRGTVSRVRPTVPDLVFLGEIMGVAVLGSYGSWSPIRCWAKKSHKVIDGDPVSEFAPVKTPLRQCHQGNQDQTSTLNQR